MKPDKAVAEMYRIQKPSDILIISSLNTDVLNGLDRIRCLIHVISQGLIGYRAKPPKGFGRNVMTGKQLATC